MTERGDENGGRGNEWVVFGSLIGFVMLPMLAAVYLSAWVERAAVELIYALDMGLNGKQQIVIAFALILSPLLAPWMIEAVFETASDGVRLARWVKDKIGRRAS